SDTIPSQSCEIPRLVDHHLLVGIGTYVFWLSNIREGGFFHNLPSLFVKYGGFLALRHGPPSAINNISW
ncbi:hypothetical protein ABFV62_31060, partial [Pseudomonas syringae]|uniref:hypothetical protein n=1 Tax=Pseudomonas syringae TaxID=317 RepID=UPI0034D78B43